MLAPQVRKKYESGFCDWNLAIPSVLPTQCIAMMRKKKKMGFFIISQLLGLGE